MKRFLLPVILGLGFVLASAPADAAAKRYGSSVNNFNATAAPGVNDDLNVAGTFGYSKGSLWFDATNNKLYICKDPANGAAVWTDVTGAAGGVTTTDTPSLDLNGTTTISGHVSLAVNPTPATPSTTWAPTLSTTYGIIPATVSSGSTLSVTAFGGTDVCVSGRECVYVFPITNSTGAGLLVTVDSGDFSILGLNTVYIANGDTAELVFRTQDAATWYFDGTVDLSAFPTTTLAGTDILLIQSGGRWYKTTAQDVADLKVEANNLGAAVTWANIPDANVPSSAVTQHETALEGVLDLPDLQGSLLAAQIAGADKTGADADLVTGTAGTNGNCAEWNVDGDLVDSGGACGGAGATNITIVETPTNVQVNSSSGTDDTIALADNTNAGVMAPAEHTKLTGIAEAATANSSDATLLARANHTGTQIATTISDFNSAALTAAPAETTTTTGALINGATAKTTPVDADFFGLMDSAASNILKKLSWANVKATLKTYFDSLTTTLTNKTMSGASNTFSNIPGTAIKFTPNNQTTSYNIVAGDRGKVVTCNNGTSMTVTFPTAAITWTDGDMVYVVNKGAGPCTIAGSGVTISVASDQTLVLAQYKGATVMFTSDTTAILTGGMTGS